MSLIEVKGLKKSFGSLDVLKGIDLTVNQGERIAIIGGSGCGKSDDFSTENRPLCNSSLVQFTCVHDSFGILH